MSLHIVPLITIPLVVYNIVAAVAPGADADTVFRNPLFGLPLPSGGRWVFSWGDLLLLVTLFMLFIEIVKSTYTSSAALTDHALSVIVFIICLIEFLLVEKAGTSLFFMITLITLIDVIAGYTIGIRVARRDFQIGSDS